MKYFIIVITAVFALGACAPKTNSPEQLREKISKYKSKVTDLNNKIRELELQLEQDSLAEGDFVYTLPVRIDTARLVEFKHYFEVGGTVEAVQEAFISPEINGRISKIHVKEGQFVIKGTLLAQLNSEITESGIAEVRTNLELAEVMYRKQKELWDQKIGSEIQYLQAKSNKEALEARLNSMKAQLAMTKIKAPFSGIVDQIFHKEGEMAVPGMQMIRLVNLGDIIVSADVSETYINAVSEGDLVSVEFPSYGPGKTEVRISRTGNVISSNNRTFPVEMRMKNEKNRIKPNSMALVHLNDYSVENIITVPSIIIKQDVSKGYFLFVAVHNEDGLSIARKRFVTTGKSYKGKTEILAGLEPGELVIVEGYNTVANGTVIEIR